MGKFDASSKWLIQNHGDALLRLAGVGEIASWRSLQAELVQPLRIPDGLIEAYRPGEDRPIIVVLEISSYPYGRLARQALADALLFFLMRGIVPEVVALVLRQRGRKPVPRELTLRSDEGTTSIRVTWRVVELWKIRAADLLAADDVGLIPLVPLADFEGPFEPIVEECRERIESVRAADERQNLQIATHILAGLKYNDPKLFEKLGGDKAMLKTGSPLIREIIEEETRKARREERREARREMAETAIASILKARFGPEAEALSADLKAMSSARLKDLFGLAATCPDLASFREQIAPRKRKRGS